MQFIYGLASGLIISGIGFMVFCKCCCKRCNCEVPNREAIKLKAENIKKLEEFVAGQDKVERGEVEKFLGVAHATAVRYLNDLESKGVIRQVGTDGPSVYYAKK